MPLGNVGETVSGMFGDLKSRLGFDRDEGRYDDRDDRRYDDRYDDRDDNYDNYDEYSNFDDYSHYDEGNYNDNEPVGGYRPLTDSVAYSPNRYSSSDISSSLVSIDDVKISTPLPDLSGYDKSSYDEGYRAPSASGSTSSSASSVPAYAAPSYIAPRGADAGASARLLTVIKPVSYDDVERVARAVKSGDVVVLDMHLTQDELSKRILDFSFGVASALDANVECPGDKVFAIARGNSLTDEEKRRLNIQGVL